MLGGSMFSRVNIKVFLRLTHHSYLVPNNNIFQFGSSLFVGTASE
jgi:hypothetical protein